MLTNTLLLLIGTIIVLFTIAYQDLRYRAVTWILFPLLAILGIFYFYNSSHSSTFLLWSVIGNLSFIAVQMILLAVYFSIKNRKQRTAVLNKKIGTGDILFLLASACFFPFPAFILFYIISLLISLLFFLFFMKSAEATTIPLAGLQSIFLAMALVTNIFMPIIPGLCNKLLSV